MTYTYMIYFSDEKDGNSHNIGDNNLKRVVDILFKDLQVIEYSYDNGTLTVKSELRLELNIISERKQKVELKYKSGKIIRPYIMCEFG